MLGHVMPRSSTAPLGVATKGGTQQSKHPALIKFNNAIFWSVGETWASADRTHRQGRGEAIGARGGLADFSSPLLKPHDQ